MELWNRHISSVTHSLRGGRHFLGAFLICCILCPLTVESEAVGPSQRKFVWTTAWPMEENYVTYKLIGPLMDKGQTNLVSLPSSSTNQRNLQSQQNFFLYLSTPKVSGISCIEVEKKVTSMTEASKVFEKVRLKTEVELDEMPGKLEGFSNEEQAHQHIVSLVNPGYFGRTSNSAVKQRSNSIPLPHKTVFSEHKHCSFAPSKFAKSKKHASELRSDQSDPLTRLTNHFPRDNLSKLIDEVNSNACNLPEFICKEGKNYYMSTVGLKKNPNSFEPSDQIGKQPFRMLPHRSVLKKARTNIFLTKKPKTSETLQFSRIAKITPVEGENALSKTHPVTKGNKPKYGVFNDTPSNILKVVKISTNNHFRSSSMNDSANIKHIQSPYFKICGRFPPSRSENGSLSISKYPSVSHNLRGHVMSSYYDMSKVRGNKDFKSDPKSERIEKTIDVNTKSSVKFPKSGSISKVAGKKEKLPPNTGDKGSTKKRRENPDEKEFSKEKNTSRIIQTRVKKFPLRYRSRSIKRMRGPTMVISNYNN